MLFKPSLEQPNKTNRPPDLETNSGTAILGAFDQPSNIDGNPRVRMAEFLTSIGMADRYAASFKKAGITTVDDFMELDPDKLTVLSINE